MDLLGRLADPKFWAQAREKEEYKDIFGMVKKEYEELVKETLITPKFSEFRMYKDCGDRSKYQKSFFQRQHRLYAAALMTLTYPEDDRYLEVLQDYIWDWCDQYLWALPAHVSNSWDVDKANKAILDLDSTTSAMSLAMIKQMLGERLHPLIRDRIDKEIEERVLRPFLEQPWYWEDLNNNWTAVCCGAVGCTFMLNAPDKFFLVKDRINHDMRKYIASYKDDGVCGEGPGYWGYGFSYFVEYAFMLKEFTDGREDFFKKPKVRNIAEFFCRLHLQKDVMVTYGDCGNDVTVPMGLIYRLRRIYRKGFEITPRSRLYFSVHYFPLCLSAIRSVRERYIDKPLYDNAEHIMEQSGLYVRRTPYYGFALKGGSNSESHNHNDVGMILFAKNNESILTDIGTRPYTRQYFESATRYTFVETSSRGHSVPLIDGHEQVCVGDNSSDSRYQDGTFTVEMERAYQIPYVQKVIRSAKCDEKSVTVCDTVVAEKTVDLVSRFVTFFEPSVKDGAVEIHGLTITFDPKKAKASYTTEEHALKLDEQGNTVESQTVYLVDLQDTSKENQLTYQLNA